MKTRIIILVVLGILIIGTVIFYLVNKGNKTFDIVIDNDTESSYLWDFEIQDKDIVEFQNTKEEKGEDDSAIKKHYIFKVLKSGTTKIIFRNGSSDSVSKVKTYEISIKNDKVDIKEIEREKTFEITQTKNSGVEYKWTYKIEDESIVKLNKETEKAESDEIIDGGIVDVIYTFEALKEGETTIDFKYISFDGKDLTDEVKYKVTIDKNMDITIKEIGE